MRYRVNLFVEGRTYEYGTYSDRNKANEVAMRVRDTRGVRTWVEEVE